MKDFRWHCNNVLHKIYIWFYVQFIHFVMMTFIGDWDICYILISTGYMKSGSYTSQGLKQTFSSIPVFVGFPLSKSALHCRLSKFKHEKIIVNSAWTSEFHQGLGEEPYASIRLAQKNYVKEWHLWPLTTFDRGLNFKGAIAPKDSVVISPCWHSAWLTFKLSFPLPYTPHLFC